MSLVSYNELCEFVERGVIEGVDLVQNLRAKVYVDTCPVNGAQVDTGCVVSLKNKDPLLMSTFDITGTFYLMQPGEFILAHTIEKFNLPDNLSAEFKLNSSGARIGLENALATWCDPWWHGSVLTLELKNFTRYHTIRLDAGCRIGQMIFHKSEPVPKDRGYAVRGRYNQDSTVSGVKV